MSSPTRRSSTARSASLIQEGGLRFTSGRIFNNNSSSGVLTVRNLMHQCEADHDNDGEREGCVTVHRMEEPTLTV